MNPEDIPINATLRPECFGTYDTSFEKDCVSCKEHNVECFITTMLKEACFQNAIHSEDLTCKNHCSANIREKCEAVRWILTRVKEKACFGEEPVKDDCLSCGLFNECEVAQLIRMNMNSSISEAELSLTEQIAEMKNEEGRCFGDFSFEKQCWEECQWTTRCRRESRVTGAPTCKFYDEENGADQHFCDKCYSKPECDFYHKESLKEKEKEKEETKVFKSFFSITEMRETMEVKDA